MSFLTPPTCLALGETLIEIARVEQQIEVIRKLLCEQPRFHPYLGFKIIDRMAKSAKSYRQGYLLPSDIKSFLDGNGFPTEIHQCKVFISNYDHDNDGTLQYSEFLRAVLPLTAPDLRQEVSLKQPNLELDQRSEYALAKLIDREIKLSLELDFIKEQLLQCYDFTPQLCFKQIDSQSKGKLYMEDLEYFFFVNAIIVYEDEIMAMFRRIDFLNDGMIDSDEFCRALAQHATVPTDSKYQSPIRGSQYLQRYLYQKHFNISYRGKTGTFPRHNTQVTEHVKVNSLIYDTPPKTAEPLKQMEVSSLERGKRSKANPYEFDETMSNVITQSQPNKTTKIIKNYDSPLRNSQINASSYSILQPQHKTPQKYIDQKADLRAQLQLSKLNVNTSQTAKPLKKQDSRKRIKTYQSATKTPNRSQASTKANTTQKTIARSTEKKPVSQRKASGQVLPPQPQHSKQASQRKLSQHSPQQPAQPPQQQPQKVEQRPLAIPIQESKTTQSRTRNERNPSKLADPQVFYSQILIDVMEVEKNLEMLKQELALRPDFNLYDAFRAVDEKALGNDSNKNVRLGHTTGPQLDQFVNMRPGTMNLLVLKYGAQGSMRFSDFLFLVMPRSRDHSDLMQSRQPAAALQLFSAQTLTLFREVLIRCLEREISLERVREQIKNYPYSNLQEAFQLIDIKTRDGWLSLEDIDEFLINQNVKYSIADLSLLIRTLDYNGDGYVTPDDFVNILSL